MTERCKLNPCCTDHYNCKPPVQLDGSRWDDETKRWIKPVDQAPTKTTKETA